MLITYYPEYRTKEYGKDRYSISMRVKKHNRQLRLASQKNKNKK